MVAPVFQKFDYSNSHSGNSFDFPRPPCSRFRQPVQISASTKEKHRVATMFFGYPSIAWFYRQIAPLPSAIPLSLIKKRMKNISDKSV